MKRKINITYQFKDATYAASDIPADSLTTEEKIAARLWLVWRYQLDYQGQLEGFLIKKEGKIIFRGRSTSVDGHMTESETESGIMPERFIGFVTKAKTFIENAEPKFRENDYREWRFNPECTPDEYIYIDLDNDRNYLSIRVSLRAGDEDYQERMKIDGEAWKNKRLIPLETPPPCRDEIIIDLKK